MSRRTGRLLSATLAAGLVLSMGGAALAGPPVGALKQFKVPTANSDPRAITTGSDGNRWFTESDANNNFAKLARITPAGAITEFTPGVDDGCNSCGLHDIAQGPGGILYITNNSRELIRFNVSTLSFVRPAVTIQDALINNLDNLAASATDVWITQAGANLVFRYRISDGQVTTFQVDNPGDVAVDRGGNAWVTERGTSNSIARIDAATGLVSHTPASDGATAVIPQSITVATDGQVWFTSRITPQGVGRLDPNTNAVSIFRTPDDPATGDPGPFEIAAGPGGSVWFTQQIRGNVARIDNSGTITEGKVVRNSMPFGVTVDPNTGDPWYTMQDANKIATLQLK